jgi:hypothetical protein
VCILTTHSAHEAAGASGARHSPRPLFSGRMFWQTSGASRRENAKVWLNVIARSAATKQSTLTYLLSFLLIHGLLRCARNDGFGCLKIESELPKKCGIFSYPPLEGVGRRE